VTRRAIDPEPSRSSHKPEALPERVRAAKLFELGPVRFPAYAGATEKHARSTFTWVPALGGILPFAR
jgi:hypothetical protein